MKKKLIDNLGLKILALAIAVVIWILVVSINDPVASKTYRAVPVTVLNDEVVTSEGKTYQIETGGEVNVTVRAQRSVLSEIEADNIVATADLKEMTLSSMIPINITITGYEGRYQRVISNPLNMEVSIEDIVSNKYPITVETTGTLRDGFALAGTEVDPETVTVTGPESVINSIESAAAEISLSGISSNTTIKTDLTLYDADHNPIDQTRLTNNIGDAGISVNVSVNPTRSVPISVREDQIVTPGGYYLADVSYEPEKVEIAGNQEVLKEVSEIAIPASAFNLSQATDKEEVTLDIEDYLPEGVQLTSSEKEKVVFTFNIARLGEKKIDIPTGSIIVENLADGLQLTYKQTDDIQITVQGPQSELNDLTLAKAVSVDLKSYTEPGTYEVPLSITLPERCSAESVTVEIVLEKK